MREYSQLFSVGIYMKAKKYSLYYESVKQELLCISESLFSFRVY
jgi:hypothetical protein